MGLRGVGAPSKAASPMLIQHQLPIIWLIPSLSLDLALRQSWTPKRQPQWSFATRPLHPFLYLLPATCSWWNDATRYAWVLQTGVQPQCGPSVPPKSTGPRHLQYGERKCLCLYLPNFIPYNCIARLVFIWQHRQGRSKM